MTENMPEADPEYTEVVEEDVLIVGVPQAFLWTRILGRLLSNKI